MQIKAQYLGVIMCGTPQCIEDTRRGVFSYEALKSRLENSRFSDGTTRDLLAPIIKLKSIHALIYKYEPKLKTETLQHYIKTEFSQIGVGQNITGGDSFDYSASAKNDENINEEFKGFEI